MRLGGQLLRSVQSADRRVVEAKKLGFTQAIAPGGTSKNTFIKTVGDLRTALIDYLQK